MSKTKKSPAIYHPDMVGIIMGAVARTNAEMDDTCDLNLVYREANKVIFVISDENGLVPSGGELFPSVIHMILNNAGIRDTEEVQEIVNQIKKAI